MSTPPGMQSIDPYPDVLIPAREQAILFAIATFGGTELSVNNGAGMEHIIETFEMLKFKAMNDLGLQTPTFYAYRSTVQPNSQFIIAGPAGMVVTSQTQPQHVRMELILNTQGEVIQAGEVFITELAFPEAAPLNPPNNPEV
jgi:hypothetical protein